MTAHATRYFPRVAYAGFLLWAISFFWGPAGPYLMTPLLLAWFVYWCRTENPGAARSPLVWLVWLFTFYVCVRGVIGYLADPATAALQDKIVADYFKIGGLWALLIAPWLTGSSGARNRNILFGFALIGFLGEAGRAVPWGDLDGFIQRRGETVADPNASATVAGVFFLLVLFVGGGLLVRWARRGRWRLAGAGVLPWAGLLVFLGFLLLATQSRSAWLALCVVLVLALGAAVWLATRYFSSRRTATAVVMGGCAGLVLAALALGQIDVVQKRVSHEHETIEKVLSLQLADLEPGSTSNRIWLYQHALSTIPERPVFGYSPGGVEALVWSSPNEHIRHYGHFHNLYLDIAAGLGLLGLGMFLAMVGLSVVAVVRAFGQSQLPLEWTGFWLAGIGFVAIDICFDTRLFIYDFGAVMALLGSLGIGYHLELLRGARVSTWAERSQGAAMGGDATGYGRDAWTSA